MRTSHSVLADTTWVKLPKFIVGVETYVRAVASNGVTMVGRSGSTPISSWKLCTSCQAGPNRHVSDRPAILEMLALRRAAQRVVELTEMLLLSLVPVTGGRTGPLKFAIAMTGPSLDEARNVVEQVVSQVQGNMPDSLDLAATIVRAEPGQQVQALLDD